MQSIEGEEDNILLPEKRRGPPLSQGDKAFNHSRSCTYYRLPQHHLKLSILKLDGSSFEVQVAKTASVLELKLAVEEVFSHSPTEGEGRISWSHVWGHFCLCYEGNRLLNDKVSLRTYGIKDGDQLNFNRHLSINYNPFAKRCHRNQNASFKHQQLLTGPDVHEGAANKSSKKEEDDGSYQEDKLYFKSSGDETEVLVGQHTEFKMAHFLKGCLSYSRLCCLGRRPEGGLSRPLQFGGTP